MTVTTVRPNGVRSGAANYSNVGGAASHAAALADNLGTTYIRKSATGTASIILNCGTFSLTSTQAIKQVRLQINYESTELDSKANVQLGVRSGGINYFGPAYQIRGIDALNTYAAPWYTTAPNGQAWSQALLNEIIVQFTDYRDAAKRAYFYELLVDVDVVNAPTTTVSSPSGTVTTTTSPDVSWSFSDTDGDAQAYYQVKVFSAAQYGAAGFEAGASTATWDSGEIASADTSATIPIYLSNSTTYRAYVRTGKTLNGAPFWSAWAFLQFTISVTPPTTPTVAATWDSTNNRVLAVLTGAAPTGFSSQTFDLERSDDGGVTWAPVRDGSDLVPSSAYTVSIYDYDCPRGITARYRARSVGVIGDNEIASGWSSTATAATTNDGTWWLKVTADPDLNLGGVQILADPEMALGEDVGVFTPIGRTTPVVISGGFTGVTGSWNITVTGATEWDDLYALLSYPGTLLVQSPFGDQMYVRITDRSWKLTGSTTAPRRVAAVKYVEVSGA